MSRTTALTTIVLLAAGCGRGEPEPPREPAPARVESPATSSEQPPAAPPTTAPAERTGRGGWTPSEDPKTAEFLGLEAPKPPTWIEHPPTSSMRAANYTVPGRDGHEPAEIVVFYFGPDQGGTIEHNIARWESQFKPDEEGNPQEALVERTEVAGMPVTLVELRGEWMKMGTGWYTPDQLFLAAIVEAPIGNIFIRFAGETATVEANRVEWHEMIEGLGPAE